MELFKPTEHREDYHNREPNNKNFLLELEVKEFISVGENLVGFGTKDKIIEFFSKKGFNDVSFKYAYGTENIHFMLHGKYIPNEELKKAIQKDEFEYLYKKNDELKGDIITNEKESIFEHGNNFISCKNFHDRGST